MALSLYWKPLIVSGKVILLIFNLLNINLLGMELLSILTALLKGLVNKKQVHGMLNFLELSLFTLILNTLNLECLLPANFVLKTVHKFDDTLPVDANTISTWKDGHPKFSLFKIDQKVVHKMNKIGYQLCYKLGRKYIGTLKIINVQSNGVSYIISKSNYGKIHLTIYKST